MHNLVLIKSDLLRVDVILRHGDIESYAVAEILDLDTEAYFGALPFTVNVVVKFADPSPPAEFHGLVIKSRRMVNDERVYTRT